MPCSPDNVYAHKGEIVSRWDTIKAVLKEEIRSSYGIEVGVVWYAMIAVRHTR